MCWSRWVRSITSPLRRLPLTREDLAIMTARANKWGCIIGAWFGMAAGLISWLSVAGALNDGLITVDTTYQDRKSTRFYHLANLTDIQADAMLAGSLSSICSGALIATISSCIWPENYDFADTRAMHAPVSSSVIESESDGGDGAEKKTASPGCDLEAAEPTESATASVNLGRSLITDSAAPLRVTDSKVLTPAEPIDFEGLTRDFNFARKFSLSMVLLLCILVSSHPAPLKCTRMLIHFRQSRSLCLCSSPHTSTLGKGSSPGLRSRSALSSVSHLWNSPLLRVKRKLIPLILQMAHLRRSCTRSGSLAARSRRLESPLRGMWGESAMYNRHGPATKNLVDAGEVRWGAELVAQRDLRNGDGKCNWYVPIGTERLGCVGQVGVQFKYSSVLVE